MDYRGPLTYCGKCSRAEFITTTRDGDPCETDVLRSSVPRVVKEDCNDCYCDVLGVSSHKVAGHQRLAVRGPPGRGTVSTLDRAKDRALLGSCSMRLREDLITVGWLNPGKGPSQGRSREGLINEIHGIIKSEITACRSKSLGTMCPSLRITPCNRRFIISERVATTKTLLHCPTCDYFVCYVCGEKDEFCLKAGVCPEFLTDHSALTNDIPQCIATFHRLRLIRSLVAARVSLGTEIFDMITKYYPALLAVTGVEHSELVAYVESPPVAIHRTDATIKYRLP